MTLQPTFQKKKKKTLQPTLQQKNVYYNKKNHCNNIEVIAIVYAKYCNKIWGNKFVLPKKFVAINLKYFNENFDVIVFCYCNKQFITSNIL